MESAFRSIQKIGWIGTGVMGKSMAGHLINKGYKLNVFNRTPEKAQGLIELGATFMTPIEIAKESDIIFLMLGYPQDLENILFKTDGGILGHMQKGAVLVDHTTSSPNLAKTIHQKSAELGVYSIDAPVSGGDIGAKNGQLVVMCGGEQAPFDHVSLFYLIQYLI